MAKQFKTENRDVDNEGLGGAIDRVVDLCGQSGQIIRLLHEGNRTGIPLMLVPKADGACELTDLSQFVPLSPDRKRIVVDLYDVKSFIAYLKEQATDDSRIFAKVLAAPYTLGCSIDFHPAAKKTNSSTAWLSHQVVLHLTETETWKRWNGNDHKMMAQDDFAIFIEENQVDVVKPDGATMLELAKSISATQGATFKTKIRLDNGDYAMTFDATTKAAAGLNGKLQIPQSMVLEIAPFIGMTEEKVSCRFRYRMDPPNLTLGYEIEHKQDLILKAIRHVMDVVTEETKVPAFIGDYKPQLP